MQFIAKLKKIFKFSLCGVKIQVFHYSEMNESNRFAPEPLLGGKDHNHFLLFTRTTNYRKWYSTILIAVVENLILNSNLFNVNWEAPSQESIVWTHEYT